MNRFQEHLSKHNLTLERGTLQTLQINVGRKCNQACRHCHVDAAPWRTEMMDRETAHRIGKWIKEHRPSAVDITGGAPEISDFFRYFVETSREVDAHVIDRNNLTIIEEPGYEYLPEYLARYQVEVVASLPCYSAKNVNKQRGNGVFDKSISALRKLNQVGYGSDPLLQLNLVYNPVGAMLPSAQEELEADYKEALETNFGIRFNKLFTITNQPIARFAEDLRKQDKWDSYMDLLADNFNPHVVEEVMCRSTLSIDYYGRLYDCDFNQMLEMNMGNGKPLYLWDITPEALASNPIQTGHHCLACTAGCGSSCTGALKE